MSYCEVSILPSSFPLILCLRFCSKVPITNAITCSLVKGNPKKIKPLHVQYFSLRATLLLKLSADIHQLATLTTTCL